MNLDFNWATEILGVSAFLFGLLIAFTISNSHSRLNEIRDKLREQDALLLSISYLSKNFDSNIFKIIKNKIDELLISQIDYNLIDFDIKTPEKLRELYDYIEKIKFKGRPQIEAHEKMLDALNDILKIHEAISYRVKNKMRGYEWISLFLLGGIILFCFLALNNKSPISIIVLSIFTSAISLLFFILSEIESLGWQESNWIWEPLVNLFLELKLLPYFPKGIIKKKRVNIGKLVKTNKIRIAEYPFPYPNMKGKIIKIISIKDIPPKSNFILKNI